MVLISVPSILVNGQQIFGNVCTCCFPGVLCSKVTLPSDRIHCQDATEGTTAVIIIISIYMYICML